MRLRRITGLLDRGYTLASIKELLEAWDTGRGLGGVLGLVAEIDGPWTDEEPGRTTRSELGEAFGGERDDAAVEEAVELGILVPLASSPDDFLVPSPRLLSVAAELHAAGVPLAAISGHLRELRVHVEHIASRFLDFTTEHVFHQYLDHPPTDEEADEAADLVRRLRPLAQQTVDSELARAMRALATRHLRDHLAVPPTVEMHGEPITGATDEEALPRASGPRPRRGGERRRLRRRRHRARGPGPHHGRPRASPLRPQRSASQLPWNPYGTRCGRCMDATGGAARSSASSITRSLVSVAASWT